MLRLVSSRFLSSCTRPFRVLGVQQVALGGPDKSALAHLWTDLLGVPKVHSFSSASENVDEDVLQIGTGSTAVEIDLMQPLDIDAKPRVHIPPLNHIGLWIDDLESCVEFLDAKGVRMAPGGIRKGASGHNICFIHPKSANGVLLELVQATPEVIRDLNPLSSP